MGAARTGARLPRPFWTLWSCTVTSNATDGITTIALAWVATTVTRDAALVAAVAAAQRLPWLLLALPCGALIDRSNRFSVMAHASFVRSVTLGVLAVLVATGDASVAALVLVALALGATEVLFDTAAETGVVELVPKDRLLRANGHLRSGEIVASEFTGRPVGGLLLRLGLAVPFVVTAAGGLVVGFVLYRLGRGRSPATTGPRQRLWREVSEGLATVWRTPVLRLLALAAVGINTLFAAVLSTQVLFVQQVLELGTLGFGLLLGVGSVGAVLGSQSASAVVGRAGPATTLVGSLAVIGLCFLAVAAAAPSVPAVAALYVAAGACVTLYGVASLTVRQAVAPAHLLGRVNAVLRLATWGMSAAGMLLGGVLVEALRGVLPNTAALTAPYVVAGAAYPLLAALLLVPMRRAIRER